MQRDCGSKGSTSNLVRDLASLATASGSDLRFLACVNAGKHIKFAEYVKDNAVVADSEIGIYWNQNAVDGKLLMPKLPFHIPSHR